MNRADVEAMITGTGWTYIGDEQPLDYGGTLIKIDPADQRNGYAEVIRITGWSDLCHDDRGCAVEVGSVFLERPLREWRRIVESCANGRRSLTRIPTREYRRLALIEACIGYWGIDTEMDYRTRRDTGLQHLLNRSIS